MATIQFRAKVEAVYTVDGAKAYDLIREGAAKMTYEVSTFDVCAIGFERLRSYEEFILTASINADTKGEDIRDQWLDDIEACMRPDGFDYDAARQAVETYWHDVVRPLFDRNNPFNLEKGCDGIGFDEEKDCTAFLFIRVKGAHFPVY
jgi:hypothetical protein